MARKLTQEEFINRYQALYPKFLFDRTIYIKDSIKVEVGCSICGHYRYLSPEALRNKKAGCPYCSHQYIGQKRRQKNIQLKLEAFKRSTISHRFDCNEDCTKIICKSCGRQYAFRTQDYTCYCEHPYDTDWFIKKSKERFGDMFDYSKAVYTGTNKYLTLICNTCKKEFQVKPNWHFYTGKCPYCNSHKSHGYSLEAVELFDNLSKRCHINIQHSLNGREYCISYKDLSGKKKRIKVDGYNHKLNLVLEFNGDLFHGNPKLFKGDEFCHPYKKIPARDLYQSTINKENLLKSLGYNVISIWEYDYNLNRDSYIENLVNEINILKENSKNEDKKN